MKPIRLPGQGGEQIKALDDLYRHSKDGRLRQRAHIVLLAAEQDFFDRYRECPNPMPSVIGTLPT